MTLEFLPPAFLLGVGLLLGFLIKQPIRKMWRCFQLETTPIPEQFGKQLGGSWRDTIFELNEENIVDLNEHFDVSFNLIAIWARLLNIPYAGGLNRNLQDVNAGNDAVIPNLEHWAFVARGTIRTLRSNTFGYFVAHFNPGQHIPAEPDQNALTVTLRFSFSKERAASEVRGETTFDVFIRKPEIKDNVILSAAGLRDPNHAPNRWTRIQQPLSLKELAKKVYQTTCSGLYDELKNHCQDFANSLFQVAKGQNGSIGDKVMVRSWAEIAIIILRFLYRKMKKCMTIIVILIISLTVHLFLSFFGYL